MGGKVQVARRERLSRICKHIIDGGPSIVDDSVTAQFKSAALRFVHTQYDDETEGLEALYHDDGELGSSVRKAVEVIDEADRADDIAKARNRGAGGHRSLTGALLEHLHDRLERRREQHGYQKKESPMSSLQDIAKTHGVAGVVQIAKNIVEEQKSFRITEEEFCKLIDTAARVAHPELGARAFEKVHEHNSVLARAIAVIKAGLAEELLSGGLPVLQVGGEDTRDLSDTSKAIEQLKELGARRWPTESASAQFERALTDPANHKLARVAVPIPRATTFFPMPR
jgi:hypothetical protein